MKNNSDSKRECIRLNLKLLGNKTGFYPSETDGISGRPTGPVRSSNMSNLVKMSPFPTADSKRGVGQGKF